jgi:hypothetical protein
VTTVARGSANAAPTCPRSAGLFASGRSSRRTSSTACPRPWRARSPSPDSPPGGVVARMSVAPVTATAARSAVAGRDGLDRRHRVVRRAVDPDAAFAPRLRRPPTPRRRTRRPAPGGTSPSSPGPEPPPDILHNHRVALPCEPHRIGRDGADQRRIGAVVGRAVQRRGMRPPPQGRYTSRTRATASRVVIEAPTSTARPVTRADRHANRGSPACRAEVLTRLA